MSWQRPPFDPRRAKTWQGGFSRVFGIVSDGITHTYGLRATAAAYLVLFDKKYVDAEEYSINTADKSVYFSRIPPAGGWIEIMGFGVEEPYEIDPAKWMIDDIDQLMAKLPTLTPAIEPRYAIEQLNTDTIHSTNGVVIGRDGELYLIPQDEYDIIRVSPSDGVTERIRVPELDLYDYGKFAGGFAGPNGKVYGIPDKAAAVMEFDPITRKGKMLQIEPTLGDSVWTNDMINTGATVGSKTYGIPFDADFFMIIDNYGDKVWYDTLGLDLSAPGKWYGGVHYNGGFFAVPYNHTAILHIKPDGSVALIPLTTAHPEYAGKYRGACVIGNKAYFAPFEADHVLVFDMDTFQMTEERYGLDLSGRYKFWGCAAADGRVVFVPFEAREIMEVDTRDDTAKFTTYNLYEDVLDVFRSYAGAYTDGNSRIHFISYNGQCGLVVDVIRQTAFVRKTTGKTGMYSSSEVAFQDGCYDGEGRVFLNPYNSSAVHWTLDTRHYAVERDDADWWWQTEKGVIYHRPTYGEKGIGGVRDFGDHYWFMRDDGDINQKRLSGYEWGFWMDLGPNQDPVWIDYVPPTIKDPEHFPTWIWKRNKAFFGFHSCDNGRIYNIPSSQPFYADRVDMPEKIYGTTTPRVGLSRDQWYNGVVQGADGKHYGIPYNGTHVLVFDPITETTEYKDYGIDMLGRRKWYGGVRYGDYIFGIPFDYPGFLVINTATGTAGIQTYGYDWSGKRKFMSAVRRSNELIFVPCDYKNFFVFRPDDTSRDVVDYGIPRSIMDLTLKWGSAGLDANNYLVCGPLGAPRALNTPSTTAADLRPFAWLSPTGQAGWSTQRSQGCGSGTLYAMNGTMLFRKKETFATQATLEASPFVVPALFGLFGEQNLLFRQFRNVAAFGYNTDCCYAVDQKFYTMTEGRDMAMSVNSEDWSVYNEFYDNVPGIRPWLGYPPAAWTQFDPDEEAQYPLRELYATRKTTLWNDPIFVGNNTAYAIHCSGGVITRNTLEQYNHFREYIWDTNNYIRCWYGSVETDTEIYAVPHSMPLLNILDKATGKSRFARFVHPAGWDHTVLFKDGTYFNGQVVFFPYKQKWFAYLTPGSDTPEYYTIPDELWVADGWRAWVRRGDVVWGVPYNASYFLKWDLATKTCERIADQPEEENWRGKLWSDALTFYKAESHAERDTTFLLPYNDDRLGVMYPWARASGPYLELEHFNTRFPGAEKWMAWCAPYSAKTLPFIYGIPYNADKVLVCDIRGDEPYTTDFGLSLDWSKQGKWCSSAEFTTGTLEARPISIFIPYNGEELLVIDHWTGKAYKPDYTGPALTGDKKWWGGSAFMYKSKDKDDPVNYAYVYCTPFNATAVLCMKVTARLVGNTPKFIVEGSLMDFGLDMSGGEKWRGAITIGPHIVMIPYNATNFLVITPPAEVDKPISDTTAELPALMLGIPPGYLTPQEKWAPQFTTAKQDEDLHEATIEYEYPSYKHPYTLRLSYNTKMLQAYMVPHEQTEEADRGWVATRHNLPHAPKYKYTFAIPWVNDTFLTIQGSKCDVHCAGLRMQRRAKFAAACLDRDDKIFCAPAGGFQSLLFDPDANTAKWIRQSNSTPRAPGESEEFAYRAPGGKIYTAVKPEYRDGLLVGSFQPVRYVWELGDVFTYDYMMEFQDTHSYWNRWHSYNAQNTAIRWRDAGCDEPANPVHLNTERRVHGCAFSSELGFGLMPGNTGNMILYKRTTGREGFARKQMSLIHNCGSALPQKVRSPSTYFPISAGGGEVWLLPLTVNSEMEIDYGSGDPFYIHKVNTLTGNMTHFNLPSPWRILKGSLELNAFQAAGYVYFVPKDEPILLDESRHPRPVMRFNPADGSVTMLALDGEWQDWGSDALPVGDGTFAVLNRNMSAILRVKADGTLDGFNATTTEFQKGFSSGDATEHPVKDGKMYVIWTSVKTSTRPVYTEYGVTVSVKDLATGDAETTTQTWREEEVRKSGSFTGSAAAVTDDAIYKALSAVPGWTTKDAIMQREFFYLKIPLDGSLPTIESAEGAPTLSRGLRSAFVAPDGKIWYEALGNDQMIRFLRLDVENGKADEPVRTQRHVGVFSATRPQFQRMRSWDGDLLYLVPMSIYARPSVLYILDIEKLEMRSYGYVLACKDTHKWNGAVYDDHRYAYGMPFNNDTVLRLDFADYNDVKIDQVKVNDYSYVETYRNTNVLSHTFHQSAPAEGYCRGGTVNKYGTILGNSYAPMDGQTLEIKPNGRSRIRAYGPDYAYPRKWADAVMGSDKKIYAAPFDSPEVLVIDPDYDLAGSSFANMYEGLDGQGKYTIAQAGNGYVVMLPFNAEDVLVVDHATEQFFKHVPPGVDLSGEGKWWGSMRVGPWAYCAAYNSEYVLKFNVATFAMELLPVPDGEGEAKWRCLVLGGNGKGYAAPFNAEDMLCVDPATDEVTRFIPVMDLTDPKKWRHAALDPDGKYIVAAGGNSKDYFWLQFIEEEDPETGDTVMKLRGDRVEPSWAVTATNSRHSYVGVRRTVEDEETVDEWIIGPSDVQEPYLHVGWNFSIGGIPGEYPQPNMKDKWWGGFLAKVEGVDTSVFLLPHNYDQAAVIAPDGKMSFQGIGLLLEGEKKWGVTFRHDDKVFQAPYDHEFWLVYGADDYKSSLESFGKPTPAGTERWASSFKAGNKYYGIPYTATTAFEIDPADPENTLVYGTLGLPGSVMTGERKWKGSTRYKDMTYCSPHNSPYILAVDDDGKGRVRNPRLRFDTASAFSGMAKLGSTLFLVNDVYDYMLYGTATKLTDKLNTPGTSTAARTGGILPLSDGTALVLPGSTRRGMLISFDEDGKLVFTDKDVGNDGTQTLRTVSAVERADKVYLMPFSTNRLHVYDMTTAEFSMTTVSGAAANGWSGQFVLADSTIIGVPYDAKNFLRITENDTVSLGVLDMLPAELEKKGKWWGAVTVGDKHYCIPYNADRVLVFTEDLDDSTLTYELKDYGLDQEYLEQEAKWRGAVRRGKYVICMPAKIGDFLVIDTEADTAELVEDISGYAGYDKCAQFYDDGMTVWLPPKSNDRIMKMRFTNDGQISVTPSDFEFDLTGEAKYAGCFAVEEQDKIVFVPRAKNHFLDYRPDENIAYLRRYGVTMLDGEKWSGVVKGPDGRAYLAGWQSSRAILDLGTWTVSNLSPTGTYDTAIMVEGENIYIKAEGNTVYRFVNGSRRLTVNVTGIANYTSDRNSFSDLFYHEGYLYMASMDSEYLFALNINTGVGYRQVLAELPGTEMWAEFVPSADMTEAYAMPFNDDRVLHCNGQALTLITVKGVPEGVHRWLGGVWYGTKIYGVPYNAEGVGIFDTKKHTFSVSTFGADMAGERKWGQGFVKGKEIYFFPHLATYILVIEPETGRHRKIEFDVPMQRDDEPMWWKWVERQGKWYGIPYQSEDVAVFDPDAETLEVKRMELDLGKETEKWACGMTTSTGDIIFMPYSTDRALYLSVDTNRARFTWGGNREWMEQMIPYAGVAKWRNNAELVSEIIPEEPEDLEEPVVKEPVDESWKYVAVSAVDGMVHYNQDTAKVGNRMTHYSGNANWPSEQFLSFVYAEDTGITYGIPFNGLGILRITNVYENGPDTGVTGNVQPMTPDLKVNYEKHSSGKMCWNIYADNFVGSTRNTKMEPVIIGGSARKMIRIIPFSGVLIPTDLNGFLEWDRPTEVLNFPDSEPIIIDHTLWDHKYSVFSAVVMAPDGILYGIANGAHWSIAWSGDDQRNKVYMPYGNLANADVIGNDGTMQGADFERYSAGGVAASGHVVFAPGTPVSAGMMSKKGGGWNCKTWFDQGNRHVDSLGHFTDRKSLPVLKLDVGVKADAAAMLVISPLINGH